MRLLERYVLAELCRVFVVLLCLMTVLLVFVGVLGQMKEHGLGPWQVVQILPFVFPILMPYAIPVALLLTVCVVYGRLSGDREVIAAKSAGIPAMYLLWPSFFFGGVLSVGSLLLSDQVIPWANASIERIATLAMEDIFLDLLRTQNQVHLQDAGVSITVMGVRDRTLINPTFRYAPNGKNSSTVQAKEARLEFDLRKNEVLVQMKHVYGDAPGRTGFWLESDERAFKLPDRHGRLQIRNLRLEDITTSVGKAELDAVAMHEQQAVEAAFALTTGDFHKLAEPSLAAKGQKRLENISNVRRLRTEYYTRFAMSMSCLFFVLVGSPFAMLAGAKQFLTSFLSVFTPILLVYYPVAMMTQNLSKTGTLEPSVAVWSANALMLVASAVFLRRVSLN
jgi:lipopolysaccharide export system permease protein